MSRARSAIRGSIFRGSWRYRALTSITAARSRASREAGSACFRSDDLLSTLYLGISERTWSGVRKAPAGKPSHRCRARDPASARRLHAPREDQITRWSRAVPAANHIGLHPPGARPAESNIPPHPPVEAAGAAGRFYTNYGRRTDP